MANPPAVSEKGFTVLYEAPHPAIDVVFAHGFTGHPRDTWTLKTAKEQLVNRAKKHGQDDEPTDGERRSKIPKLHWRGHPPPSTPASSTPQSSRTPMADNTYSGRTVGSEGQPGVDIYWPADLACKTIPGSRILTYGYDTKVKHWVQGQVSNKTVYDHGWDLLCSLEALRRDPKERSRPVLFIAHSLGGIVVKEALRKSRGCVTTQTHLHGIFEATVGLIFFGTPHRGADPRNFFHHLLTASAQALGVQVNNQVVNALMPNSELLTELRAEFSVMCREKKWRVFSFQEEYGVKALLRTKVVDDQSSCLDDPTVEIKQHISSNHMDMCRFSGLRDTEYLKVAAAITFILGKVENGTDTISRDQPLARRQSQDTSLITESEGVSREPSVVREQRDISSPPETRRGERHPTRLSHSIDALIKQSLVDQLYFDQIDERLTHLTAAYGTTCRWFFNKPEYTSWHDVAQQPEHGGFLWIKGNPGTGKSTLMKLLFEEARRNARGDPSRIMLSFFFLARGTVEEKSTTGLYRSLLYQLFEKATDLKDSLEWMTAGGARGIQRSGWSEEPLKQTLMHAVRRLESRQLTIFVDALDECRDSQAKGMICFFEELCDLAREMQVRLQICFSSRHYPHIEIKKGIEVVLEDEDGHKEDIEHYIKSTLRLRKTKQAELLQSEILEKSSRIFLWVVLVVDILNSEYPRKPIDKMRKRLEEIPQKLADLFEMILTRDGENLEQLRICLKWILFATRPLKPQELYFAIQLGLDKECSSCWDPGYVELDDMKALVRCSSKGLAEVTRNKASEVQFIHESVRDFLLGKYRDQWSGVSSNFEGHGHQLLRDCCLAQLNAPLRQQFDISSPLPNGPKASRLRENVLKSFPFLEYAVFNVFDHANLAQQRGLEQGDVLNKFPLKEWILSYNVLERFIIRRYTDSVSIIYILAERDLAELIQIHPQRGTGFEDGGERYGPPIFAALATGSVKAIRSLLGAQEDNPNRLSSLLGLSDQYHYDRDKTYPFGRDFTFSRPYRSVLSYLAAHGNEVLLDFALCCDKLDPNSKDYNGRTPFSRAAERGHVAAIVLLLQSGAKLESVDKKGRTPLSWAASNEHEAVVKLLLEKGADVDSKDTSGRTPLSWAAVYWREAVVKLLLEKGADVDSKDTSGRTRLLWAAQNGREAVAKLLLEKGADVDSKDTSSRTPLSWAAENGHEAVVKLLLEKGADVNSKDASGRMPLSWAAANWCWAVVKRLLEKGADTDSKDTSGRMPLSWAVLRPDIQDQRRTGKRNKEA